MLTTLGKWRSYGALPHVCSCRTGDNLSSCLNPRLIIPCHVQQPATVVLSDDGRDSKWSSGAELYLFEDIMWVVVIRSPLKRTVTTQIVSLI